MKIDSIQNGYVIESFERLLYGWNSEFETWNDEATGYEDDMYNAMYIAIPDTEKMTRQRRVIFINYRFFRTSSRNFQVRSVEAISRRSRLVWMSCI